MSRAQRIVQRYAPTATTAPFPTLPIVPAAKPKTRQVRKLPVAFTGICCLCGSPSRGSYCHAHSWAAGS